MSTPHPDVIAAISKLAGTALGRKYDRIMRKRYGKSGSAIAAKTVLGEFGTRSTKTGAGVVSSAGARGPAQFIPSTRADYLRKYGVDAWKDDTSAIKALMLHQINTGIPGYNPGMPTYEQYILRQKLGPAPGLVRAGSTGSMGSTGSTGSTPTPSATMHAERPMQERVTLGQSFAAERTAARQDLLTGGPLSLKRLLAYKQQMNSLQDVPESRVMVPGPRRAAQPKASTTPRTTPRTTPNRDVGVFHISGPNPGRLRPELVAYARKVARIYGKPLTGSDGTGHSYYTVDGNVSEHSIGAATDIPARGRELLRMGRAALIAAGMPRKEALKAKGGLYNVGNHQIIFLTDEGGNHFDHLHISARKGARSA